MTVTDLLWDDLFGELEGLDTGRARLIASHLRKLTAPDPYPPLSTMKLPKETEEALDNFMEAFIKHIRAQMIEALKEPDNARVTGSMNQESL